MAKKKKTKKIIIIAILVVIITTAVIVSIQDKGQNNYQTIVESYSVGEEPIVEKISANGTFIPSETRVIYSQVNGEVEETLKEGDEVTKGQLILRIDPESYELSLRQALISYNSTLIAVRQKLLSLRTDYRNSVMNLDQAKRNLDRNQELFTANAISEEALLQSEDAYSNAEWLNEVSRQNLNMMEGRPLGAEPLLSGNEDSIINDSPEIQQAMLNVDSAQKAVDQCSIYAPISGTITSSPLTPGSLIGLGTAVIQIETLDKMKASIYVDEVDIGKVIIGSEALLTTDSLIGKDLHGLVITVSPTIKQVGNSKASAVEIAIDSDEWNLMPGASCSARIQVVSRESALVIPVTAFDFENGEYFVFVIREDNGGFTLEKRVIRIGLSTIERVEVLSGLEVGELIVPTNLYGLRDGLSVQMEGTENSSLDVESVAVDSFEAEAVDSSEEVRAQEASVDE